MSASNILANIRNGWNCDPAGHVVGSRSGVSAAFWTNDRAGLQEVRADPDPTQHTVSVHFATYGAQMMIDGRLIFATQCRPGTALIVRAGDHPRAILDGPFSCLHIYIPHELLLAYAEADGTVPGSGLELLAPELKPDTGIDALGREMRAEMEQGLPLSRLRVDALGQDLGVQLLRRYSNLAGTRLLARAPRGGLAAWQVRRACEAMEARLDGDLSLDALAALAKVSPTHFSRAFKQSTGLPPFAWLLQRRVERAKALLSDRRLSLAEVALAVGFSAQPQFTTAFRRSTGITPGAWRRERAG